MPTTTVNDGPVVGTSPERRPGLAQRGLPARDRRSDRHTRGPGLPRRGCDPGPRPTPPGPVLVPQGDARLLALGSARRARAVDRGDRRPAHRALPAARAAAAAAGAAPHDGRRHRDRRHRHRADRARPPSRRRARHRSRARAARHTRSDERRVAPRRGRGVPAQLPAPGRTDDRRVQHRYRARGSSAGRTASSTGSNRRSRGRSSTRRSRPKTSGTASRCSAAST